MVLNIATDLVVGAVPLVGDLVDVGFKANRRNVDLLKRHIEASRTGSLTSAQVLSASDSKHF